jgi:hypothetical protein
MERCLHGIAVVDIGLDSLERLSQRKLPPQLAPLHHGLLPRHHRELDFA